MRVLRHHARSLMLAALLLLSLDLSGCATTGPAGADPAQTVKKITDPRDPLEGMNRAIYSFNTTVDKAIAKPVAKAYRAAIPELFRGMFYNAYMNINDVWVGANNLMQGKPKQALSDWTRVLVNSIFGFAGIADVASELGLERHNEDFGQTLGRWGMPPGPYLVLPLLGPSNFRDGIASVADWYGDPINQLAAADRDRTRMLRLIDTRANLLDAERLVDSAALDPYGLIRDGYLARRRSLIYDGDPPDNEPAYEKRSDESVSK